MDEQEIEWEEKVRELKRRIEILKQEVGYYQKGDLKCSERLKSKLKPQSNQQKDSLEKIRASVMRSALDV